jgi:hypothetical protein
VDPQAIARSGWSSGWNWVANRPGHASRMRGSTDFSFVAALLQFQLVL